MLGEEFMGSQEVIGGVTGGQLQTGLPTPLWSLNRLRTDMGFSRCPHDMEGTVWYDRPIRIYSLFHSETLGPPAVRCRILLRRVYMHGLLGRSTRR